MESIERWAVQLRKGIVELMVLRLLALRGELHGYAIVKELQTRGRLSTSGSTVYPVLKRLESDGLLTPRWSDASDGPPRKYYQINGMGESFLQDASIEWDVLVESMQRLEGEDCSE